MASDKQIEANRRNSEKCTGPRTPAGKANSSQNALKTGLDAKSEVIRTENRADYETLTAEYYARFHPTVPEERCLVDTLITSEWLRRRYVRADAAVWEQRFDDIKSESTGRVFRERSDIFARVDRRVNSAQRNFQSALKQLGEIQAKRALEPAPDLAESAELTEIDAATEELTPELDSFFTPDPSAPSAVVSDAEKDPATSPSSEKDPWPAPIAA
jgi:hypothetical protein